MPRGVVKRTPTLAAYLDAMKESNGLYSDITKHVLNKAEQPDDRRHDVIHPSEVVKSGWCMRATYYRIVNGPVRERTNFRRENIFEEGNRTHDKWQNWLAEMRRLEGEWKCLGCGRGFYARGPKECRRCGNTNIRYREIPLSAPDLRLYGRSDGYVPQDRCLIEVKTMGLGGLRYENPGFVARYEEQTPHGVVVDLDRLWKDFRRPLASALRQGAIYMHLAREYADLDVQCMVFIYDFKATQDSKFFTVAYDPDLAARLMATVKRLSDCLTARTVPDCAVSTRGCRDCQPYMEAAGE